MGRFFVLLGSEVVLAIIGFSLVVGIFTPYDEPVASDTNNVIVVYAHESELPLSNADVAQAIQITWEDLR